MKSLFTVAIFVILFSSCEKNSINEIDQQSNSSKTKSMDVNPSSIWDSTTVDGINIKEFISNIDKTIDKTNFFPKTPAKTVNNRSKFIEPVDLLFTGYQTIDRTSDKLYSLKFSADVLAQLGLLDRLYSCHLYLVNYSVEFVNSEFYKLPSPLCGFEPGYSVDAGIRGYELNTYNGNVAIMSTYLFRLSNDADGGNYIDTWAPCRKEDIEWHIGMP